MLVAVVVVEMVVLSSGKRPSGWPRERPKPRPAWLPELSSLSSFFGGFFSSWKKYFLSTYGLVRPVPSGSRSVNASAQWNRRNEEKRQTYRGKSTAPSGGTEFHIGTKSKTRLKLKELRRNTRMFRSSVRSEGIKTTKENPYSEGNVVNKL